MTRGSTMRAGCALLLAGTARAETTLTIPTDPASGVSIRVGLVPAEPARFGFSPLRVTIENGSNRDGAWTFHFESGLMNQWPGQSAYDWSVRVPAHRDAELWAYVPSNVPGRLGAGPSIVGNAVVFPPPPTGGALFGGFPGSPGWNVAIRNTSTATTVTRTAPGGSTTITERIDAITGERTTTTSSRSLLIPFSNSNTIAPPPNQDIEYTINPTTGLVRMSLSPMAGTRPHIGIVTGPAYSAARPATAVTWAPPKVIQIPGGTRVTRTVQSGGSMVELQRDIDAVTGVITTTTLRDGVPEGAPHKSAPIPPGMEATFTINPANGMVRSHREAGENPSAAPVVKIVTLPTRPPAVMFAGGSAGAYSSQPLRLAVTVNGDGIPSPATENFPVSARGGGMAPIGVSAALDLGFQSALGAGGISGANLATVDPAELPADWRVWSPFATIALQEGEYDSLGAARRAALDGWVGLGGTLVLFPTASGERRERSVGAGRVITAAEPFSDRPTVQELGDAGVVLGVNAAQPERGALEVDASPGGKFATLGTERNLDWVGIFLLGFAVLAGPVNLLVFAPPSKRQRLFLTTPLISLGGAIVLCGAIVVQDGTGGRGRRSAVVILLADEHQAVVLQEQASRSGFLTRRSFALGDDTAMAELPFSDEGAFRPVQFGAEISRFREPGLAYGDWFVSRNRQAQQLRRVVPSRARVEWVGAGPGGAPIIQSSVATRLTGFFYFDSAGKTWTAAAVEPGRQVALEPAGFDWAGESIDGTAMLHSLWNGAQPHARRHWFAAGGATDLAPIATLTSVRWSDDVHYTGILAGAPEEAK